jgi:Flagellar hook capping protein - N-terminal region
MSRIPSASPTSPSQSFAATNSLNDLDLDSFLQLMIAELQNQDPLNPLDNKDMLAQISQIREVGATDKLTETLDSVLLGQNIASATNLIGAQISALSDDNQRVDGIVERITLAGGEPKLHVAPLIAAKPSDTKGRVEAGTYGYRIAWNNADGVRMGIELSGPNAITTTGQAGTDTAILLNNLPATPGIKEIYRTDKSGRGTYQLVGTIINGEEHTFLDEYSDEERLGREQTNQFQRLSNQRRTTEVSMNNVSEIRPPS